MEGGHGVNLTGREAQVYNSELIHPFFVFCLMYEVQYTVRTSTFLRCVVFGMPGRFDILPLKCIFFSGVARGESWSVTGPMFGDGRDRRQDWIESGVAYDLPNIGRLHSFQVRAAAMHREGASGFLGYWMESEVDNAMLSLGGGRGSVLVVGDGMELRDRRPQGYRASPPRHQREPNRKATLAGTGGQCASCGDGSPPPGKRWEGTLFMALPEQTQQNMTPRETLRNRMESLHEGDRNLVKELVGVFHVRIVASGDFAHFRSIQ